MNKSRFLARAVGLLAIVVVTLTSVRPAHAAAPPNDNFENATPIISLPFSDTQDITEATVQDGEPDPICTYSTYPSIWYAYTATADGLLRATLTNGYVPFLAVYRATDTTLGGLSEVGCIVGGNVNFAAESGATYYLMLGNIWGYTDPVGFTLETVLPPVNDNFADATVISGLQYSDEVDITAATAEDGEPIPTCAFSPLGSAWYAYTPTQDGFLRAAVGGWGGPAVVVPYTGSELAGLVQHGCASNLVLAVHTGVTYYFMVGHLYNGSGPVQFSLEAFEATPSASMSVYPYDPSVFDTVNFWGYLYDPAYIPGQSSFAWDLGDGITCTEQSCQHQYPKDGDYTVSLTGTTPDGRSGTATQLLQVRTYDVAITRLGIPVTARLGQAKTIYVMMSNRRYSQDVTVELYRSVAGGWEQIGTLIMYVPARTGLATTFKFTYRFTSADLQMGKVTFQAVASISGRDAFPTDNTATRTTIITR